MRYKPSQWGSVAILMKDSSYKILTALSKKPMRWTELKTEASLTDGGLQKVLKDMINMGLVEESLAVKKDSNFKEKRYMITKVAKKEQIFEKALGLKESLDKLNKSNL